jgi:hypothetical protein
LVVEKGGSGVSLARQFHHADYLQQFEKGTLIGAALVLAGVLVANGKYFYGRTNAAVE